jgi:cob(I)alamin adenosyltransferase
MKIYTLTGDDGTTSLSGGRRIPKHSPRLEAYGTVDELIAWFGLIRDHEENSSRQEFLIYIQDQLMRCAAALAYDSENSNSRRVLPEEDCLSRIELEIDKMVSNLPALKNFILPGGNKLVSYCHIARCVCRRAERAVIHLNLSEQYPEIVNKILNRLSDYLFILARTISFELDIEEIRWII